MELVPLVLSLFTAGYFLGVWTACLVFRQPQRAYEEEAQGRATDLAHFRAADFLAGAFPPARVVALSDQPLVERKAR